MSMSPVPKTVIACFVLLWISKPLRSRECNDYDGCNEDYLSDEELFCRGDSVNITLYNPHCDVFLSSFPNRAVIMNVHHVMTHLEQLYARRVMETQIQPVYHVLEVNHVLEQIISHLIKIL